ncbi:hypothetical protein BG28_00325 [Nesterenkonia sp. AN1]|uniref:DUF3027 family protein n=1 Tax=Nesterenkonia aurantiaca TaxID=1436010 RepID=A0A4R7G2C2_9MICC|nr:MULTISPECIES: DUF3027 domain-containing protein [Nesterenkonia]EXF26064.1 hypothetical protein BG28_00325 [Nesterenkonia sp. AN1]TDS85399.1 DUF3027 family protein [Nesterenkonia aurantiaca]
MTEQTPEPATGEQSGPEQSSADHTAAKQSSAVKTRPEPAARTRRPGKPKLDALLAEAVDLAHDALYEIADPEQVGAHLGVTAEGDRLLTHRFAAEKSGYRGWEWFVTVARAPRAKLVTVCEIGLLPGEDALIAPEWVPWLERMNDEERQAHKAEQAEADEA